MNVQTEVQVSFRNPHKAIFLNRNPKRTPSIVSAGMPLRRPQVVMSPLNTVLVKRFSPRSLPNEYKASGAIIVDNQATRTYTQTVVSMFVI